MPKPKRNIDATIQDTMAPPAALGPSETIAQLKQAAGSNLYKVDMPSGESTLVELEAKFRSTIWLKRGCYVVVDTAALADRENKLGGTIVNVVGDEKAWRKASYWPTQFKTRASAYANDSDDDQGPKMPPSDDED